MDIEFRVMADRKERLLLELGQVVIASGFALLRQRLADGAEGVTLALLVRGPEDRLLALEEALATHPRVHSFEAIAREESELATRASTPSPARPINGTAVRTPAPAAAVETAFDARRVEAVLPSLAHDYPRVFPRLLALERDLGDAQRRSGLRYVGTRVGAWVYKRDFVLGGKLSIDDSIHHIALPAARQLVTAEVSGKSVRLSGSPLCSHTSHGPSCQFFEGFFEGLLNEAGNLGRVRVTESHCRATGSDSCLFDFSV
jgi:hypothetical protein